MPSPRVPVIYGCAGLREPVPGSDGSSSLADTQDLLEVLKKHEVFELDTSRRYGDGGSEIMLGSLDVASQGFSIHTKSLPSARFGVVGGYTHSAESLRASLDTSLEALKVKSAPLFYLHAPDREVPWAETFSALNQLHKEGKFERLGLSNYPVAEVEEILELCKRNDWLRPTVYEGAYSPLSRGMESELIPVLRKSGMSLVAFNQLLGGFLGGLRTEKDEGKEGSRFDPKLSIGKMFRDMYWKVEYFAASAKMDEAAKMASISMPTLVFRWIEHHSALDPAFGDRVLIGASSVQQLEGNLSALEGGPLDASVVGKINEAWELVKDVAPSYHR